MHDVNERLKLEQAYHESYDKQRDSSQLIVSTYASGIFDESENYYINVITSLDNLLVLDYGCGTGQTSGDLCARNARVVGFDISFRRLREAANASSTQLASFAQCAAEYLPFADNTFDAVMGKQILHHLDLGIAIPEIARILRPGGKAVFLEPLGHNPILEGYRRLTPYLRSPTERALRVNDLAFISAHFASWEHREFCFTSVIPVLAGALLRRRSPMGKLRQSFERLDAQLLRICPPIGRFFWETVIVLQK